VQTYDFLRTVLLPKFLRSEEFLKLEALLASTRRAETSGKERGEGDDDAHAMGVLRAMASPRTVRGGKDGDDMIMMRMMMVVVVMMMMIIMMMMMVVAG
jgi:hypothetical protein